MIPERLVISGFLSYEEPVELDFSGLHVACITGQNGAGKSAMLDAITWALFGEARKNDDSIINNHSSDNTAKVEFEFTYEGSRYRVIRSKSRGKSTTVDFEIRSEDNKSWRSLSEKRAADTTKRICSILRMDYKTFINASFFLQGKADQFTGQTAGERKRILSTILNLDVWEDYKAKAAEKRKTAELSAKQLEGLIGESESELQEEPARRERLKQIGEKIIEAEKAYNDADREWKLAQTVQSSLTNLKTILDQKQRDEARQVRMTQSLSQQLNARRQELDTLLERLSNAETVEEKYRAQLQIRSRVEQMNSTAMEFHALENRRDRLVSAIRSGEKQLRYELEQLNREKNELERQMPEQERLVQEAAALRVELEELQQSYAGKSALEQEKEAIRESGSKFRSEIDLLKTRIREHTQKIEELQKAQGSLCPTCGRVMDAEHCRRHAAELTGQIGQLQAELAPKETARAQLITEYRQKDAQIIQLNTLEKRITDLKVRISTDEQKMNLIAERIGAWENGRKKRLAEVEQTLSSESWCIDERQDLTAVRAQIAALAYDAEAHRQLRLELQQYDGIETQHQALISDRVRLEPLRREIDEKEAQLAAETAHLETLRGELKQTEQDHQALKAQMPDPNRIQQIRNEAITTLNRLHQERGQAEQLVRSLEQARVNLERYGAEFREKTVLIERLKSLEKAFGKDGIPALLIEQAIPELEEQANKLLERLSNGTMSLRMNTQTSYKSKRDDMKETLEILISDPYGSREYEMFSGGEAFRINFSIRLALSRLLAQRAGSRLQTLVIDEGFGSQDDDGRMRLAEAITAVQDDFEKILVITHLNELKEAFPARIEVQKTEHGSRMEVFR